MENIERLTKSMLSEREIIILLLVDSGMSFNDLGPRLVCSPSSVKRTYDKAKKKMNLLAEAGLLSTEIKKH